MESIGSIRLVAIDKLSISLDGSLAQIVRDAAAEENITVSAWLANAAQDRIRNRLLGLALQHDNPEITSLPTDELIQLVAAARSRQTTDHRAGVSPNGPAPHRGHFGAKR